MKIEIVSRDERFDLSVNPGHRLLDYIQDAEIPINAACGGVGSCTKCRIKVSEGFLSVGKSDQKAFSKAELDEGWRLSCQAVPRTKLCCVVPDVESLKAKPRLVIHDESLQPEVLHSEELYLACDVGSTGVVLAIGTKDKKILAEAHLLNRQVRFGADVMTRLKFAQDKGVELLNAKLIESLEMCITSLKEVVPDLYIKAALGGLYCSGNSALISFLHNWNVSSLAVYPFQPLHKEAFEGFSDKLEIPIKSLPLLGGFVGADTYAGVLYLEKTLKDSQPWMLVDIGTNTEIVIKNKKGEFYFSSAPAGPAFEGGNITHGMRAEPGAIAHAKYKNKTWTLETIGMDKPRGICGSGLLDVLKESIHSGLIQKDGFVPEGRVYLTENIMISADDVREFQLAKSATRTACDLLIERAGTKPAHIYMAGAFAEHLDKDSIKATGLLPPGIKMQSIGNTSLLGTLLYASMSEEERNSFNTQLLSQLHPIELALQDDFQDAFVKNLDF